MTIWFFIVLALGVLYVLNRLTTTTDLPVSSVLANAREIAEGGRRHEATVTAPATDRPATAPVISKVPSSRAA